MKEYTRYNNLFVSWRQPKYRIESKWGDKCFINFVENEGNRIDKKKKRTLDMISTHLKSNKSKNIKYEDPEWLISAKTQSGKHQIPQMAKLLDIPRQTLTSRILR